MREGGEGQTNQLYFEKSNERLSEGARMFTIPKKLYFQEDKCFYRFLTDVARISLFQAFVVKKIIGAVQSVQEEFGSKE